MNKYCALVIAFILACQISIALSDSNNGPSDATGKATAQYDSAFLEPLPRSSPTAYITAGSEVTFNFTFKPSVAGTGKTITANVSVI